MKKGKTILCNLLCALCGWGLVACSSEEGDVPASEGVGAVSLSLATDMGFETRTKAVDESTYTTKHPIDDYTVRILKDGTLVSGCEWIYSEIPEGLIELGNGTYEVVAFDGEEYNKNASTREGIYMYGSATFDVNSDQTETVKVACTPACGKLVVNFGEGMANYFSDYEVNFSTVAAGDGGILRWLKNDTDPLYVKLVEAGEVVTASFRLTKTDGTQQEVASKTRTMGWGSSWTINVNPVVQETPTGGLSLTIEFSDDTNDETIPIEIPSDWL